MKKIYEEIRESGELMGLYVDKDWVNLTLYTPVYPSDSKKSFRFVQNCDLYGTHEETRAAAKLILKHTRGKKCLKSKT